jgi:hypothetical protein
MKTIMRNTMLLFFVLLVTDQTYYISLNPGVDLGMVSVSDDINALKAWEPLFNDSFTPESAWSGARVLNSIIKLPKLGPVSVDMSGEALAARCL